MRRTTSPPPTRAFTLIELLVVIAIIALLIGILLPGLGMARETAKTVICGTNQKQIHTAIEIYRDDNKRWGSIHRNASNRFDKDAEWRRIHMWDDPNDPTDNRDVGQVYWGVAYDEYINEGYDVWGCPSAKVMDPDPAWMPPWVGFDPRAIREWQKHQLYAASGMETAQYGAWGRKRILTIGRGGRKIYERLKMLRPPENLPFPNDVIIFQDGFEHMMECNDDALNNLSQYGNSGWYGGAMASYWLWEYFRHLGVSQAMFADGHLGSFNKNEMDEFDPVNGYGSKAAWRYYYTGDPEDKVE